MHINCLEITKAFLLSLSSSLRRRWLLSETQVFKEEVIFAKKGRRKVNDEEVRERKDKQKIVKAKNIIYNDLIKS